MNVLNELCLNIFGSCLFAQAVGVSPVLSAELGDIFRIGVSKADIKRALLEVIEKWKDLRTQIKLP